MMRRRVLLVQPSLAPTGGGNGVAAWMLEALAPHHDVTVLSWVPTDVEAVDRFYGTTLRSRSFTQRLVPWTWRQFPRALPVRGALIRGGLLMRYTRRMSHEFDVVIGAHNEMDYGRRGIQYIHYPTYLRPRPETDLKWYHRFEPLLQAYYAAADGLAGFSVERMKRNLTLANSAWTAGRVQQLLGIAARTLYPPIVGPTEMAPWERRGRGMLAVGRISPEKNYELLMRIVARVRQAIAGVGLTIVGICDRANSAYRASLHRLARDLDPSGSWLTFHENLSRDQVHALIASHRYGIHGMREEHFGMAPAEMICGGMIVWVPNGGGQVEIVGEEPALTYESEDEAVEQILRVMRDEAEEQRLRDYLRVQSQAFGVKRFAAEVRAIVEGFPECLR